MSWLLSVWCFVNRTVIHVPCEHFGNVATSDLASYVVAYDAFNLPRVVGTAVPRLSQFVLREEHNLCRSLGDSILFRMMLWHLLNKLHDVLSDVLSSSCTSTITP